jgi:MFS family permease
MSKMIFLSSVWRREDLSGRQAWRDFRLLWSGQSVSLLGDQVFLLALVIGLPAGVWVARWGTRRSMLGADLVRGLAVLSVPVAAWFGILTFAHLLVVAVLTGVGMVFFQVAYQSYAPALISDDRKLHAANARLSFSESSSLLVGPGLAGVVISLLGPARALFADAGSYLFSVLTLASIRHREPIAGDTATRRPMRQEIKDGLRFVAGQPVLRPIMTCGALYNLGVAMYDALLVLFAVEHLHLQAWQLGLALGLGGIGFPVGSMVARRVAGRFGIGPSLLLAGVPSVLGLAVGAAAGGRYAMALLAAGTLINGVGQGVFAVNAITIRHLLTPAELATRATAVHRFITWGTLPIGSLVAGLIGTALGLRVAMLTAAITATACLVPLLSRPLLAARNLRRDHLAPVASAPAVAS